MTDPVGDASRFDQNWRVTQEAHYLHWTRGEPENQVQLAFRQHWLTFQELMGPEFKGRRVLEVGCGRGSLSAYFADAKWDCTLLDLSPAAIDVAKSAFAAHGLKAKFDVGDCLALPYPDLSFDLVFSIGLLEHFEVIGRVIDEQVRILAPGGLFIGYVVPNIPDSVQKEYAWFCNLLKALSPTKAAAQKIPIFRSNAMSPNYLASMVRAGLNNLGASGTYPLPMISHSIDFPFSLLPPEAEKILVAQFRHMLDESRKKMGGKNPWLCPEGEGQAFLVWGSKP
jgi:ubiquinone/menaquinone biosynthesis C-methylase UbiE